VVPGVPRFLTGEDALSLEFREELSLDTARRLRYISVPYSTLADGKPFSIGWGRVRPPAPFRPTCRVIKRTMDQFRRLEASHCPKELR
jgi:hypothetical protein